MNEKCPKINAIATPNAPQAIGPYSQAIQVGGLLFTSGQIPLNPNTGRMVGDTVEEQTEQVMQNLSAALNVWSRRLAICSVWRNLPHSMRCTPNTSPLHRHAAVLRLRHCRRGHWLK